MCYELSILLHWKASLVFPVVVFLSAKLICIIIIRLVNLLPFLKSFIKRTMSRYREMREKVRERVGESEERQNGVLTLLVHFPHHMGISTYWWSLIMFLSGLRQWLLRRMMQRLLSNF